MSPVYVCPEQILMAGLGGVTCLLFLSVLSHWHFTGLFKHVSHKIPCLAQAETSVSIKIIQMQSDLCCFFHGAVRVSHYWISCFFHDVIHVSHYLSYYRRAVKINCVLPL